MGDDTQILQLTLEEAFGESSDSGDETLSPSIEEAKFYSWESVDGINGLWICSDFLPVKHQRILLSAIRREGWFIDSSHNQAMRFGDLPGWADDLTRLICKAVCFGETSSVESVELECKDQQMEESGPLPFDLLWREPLFDQLIANVYQPGEGIRAHVDLMRFDDGIAIVSMESECVMHFTRAVQTNLALDAREGQNGPQIKVPVLLKPGSLVLMSGEARYSWNHEINRKPGFQIWEGKEICQQRRTSVTLRKLRRLQNNSKFNHPELL